MLKPSNSFKNPTLLYKLLYIPITTPKVKNIILYSIGSCIGIYSNYYLYSQIKSIKNK